MLQIVTVIEKRTCSVEYSTVVSSIEAAHVLADHIERLLDIKFFKIQITPSDPEILASIAADLTM